MMVIARALLCLLLLISTSFAENAPAPADTKLLAVGDVMLGRYIAKVMQTNGSDYPFRQIAPVLRSADIVLGNLEGIMTPDDAAVAYPDKPYSFHAPIDAGTALKEAGFSVLSLANNHAMDYGSDALLRTRVLLNKQGIASFGAGRDIADARAPVIVTKNGTRFGFLGYGVAHARAVYAAKKRAGISPLVMERVHADIVALRIRVDIVIVSLHWGMEYDTVPSKLQREEAHQIIDWGADVIIGHHPHVMQGVELYKGRPIAYSLGNFVFDQKRGGADWSAILACTFRGKDLYLIEAIPLARYRSYFPVVAEGKAKEQRMQELKRLAAPLYGGANAVSLSGLNER